MGSEYDIRRPLTSTGTNLLGLVRHCAIWESRYLGETFDRPFPEPLPRWDEAARGTDSWVTEHETRADGIGLYRRVGRHRDATIASLTLDTVGYVPWWQEDVPLFKAPQVLSDVRSCAGLGILAVDGAAPIDGQDGTGDP